MESFYINGVVQAGYTYDARGQQVIRNLTQAGYRIHVIHDQDGNRLAEYQIDNTTGVSTLLQEYIWHDGVPVAVVDGQTDEVFLVRTDHIGRPVFATDTSGIKVWEATYQPFGGVHVSTGANMELRFPGQWFQAESGLHQNWMREYDPTTGRYIQADPLGLVAGVSLYGYARQNPFKYVDPNGENPLIAAAIIGAVLGVAFDYAYDMTLGDGCYSWREAAEAAALGAMFSGGGFAATGIKRAGKEFSHAVPSRLLKNSRIGRWLDKKGNPYRSLNGNYVKPRTHAKTDYWRRLKGMPARDMYPAPIRYPMRAPAWSYGGLFGTLSVGNGCGCEP